MKYLFFLLILPCSLFGQKLIQQTVRNGSNRIDFYVKERLMSTMDVKWQVISLDSPMYRFKMVSIAADSLRSDRDDGVINSLIHVDATGKFLSSNKSRLSIPFSQLTGSATVGQLPMIPFTQLIGTASVAQVPQIPYSKITDAPANDSIQYFNASGRIRQKMKIWGDTVTITNSNAQSISIASAGYTRITNIQAIAIKDATSAPNVSIKSYTNSVVVLNVKEENNAVVQLLGINVLSGAPLIFATGSIKVFIRVEGY